MKSRRYSVFIESSRFSFWLVLLVDQCLAACISGVNNTKGYCADTDGCVSKSCPFGSVCQNVSGSPTCKCMKGFQICMEHNSCTTGRPYCKDVNECEKNPSNCGSGENCINTIGNYCCLFKARPMKTTKKGCSECERKCYFKSGKGDNSNSTVSDQTCMSICQLKVLYEKRRSDRFSKAAWLLNNAENTLMYLVETSSNQTEERKSVNEFEIKIRRHINPAETLMLSALGNTMEVNPAVFTGMDYDRKAPAVALIVHKNMEAILSNGTEGMEDAAKPDYQRAVLNSKVLTAVINSRKRKFNTYPITFTFSHSKIKTDNENTICVYWNMTASERFWSPEGCELVTYNTTHTVCRVYHLSSFAVLMALKVLPDVFAVEVITQVGLSISLVCLFMAIVTFSTCHPLKETRRTIHTNLCLSLFVADLVFLFGISLTGNRTLCGIIAAVLHYSFLSVFAWMFLEGIQLYLMVEIVFVSRVPLKRYIYWIGYGFPAVIVAVSAAVYHDGYGTQSSCWLKTEKYFVYSFFVPVFIISFVNFIILCKTLMKLKLQMSNRSSDQKKLEKTRVFTLTAIGQLFILGSTWILGGFYIQNATIPMMYIFTILNSFQGMFIFIMHCLLYKKVRDAYYRCLGRYLKRSTRWKPVSTSSTPTALNQGRRSVQETESTTSGVVH
ncbi:adhesion G protein-coupled receptor E1-like [Heptranchias perlo]|uniref:adhesion G protein-coupled receptor E1-like n=1 Tax=Heptranchias perlo TaxID=212740 RepID=UPI00355A9E43